jgi:hypothetical protein
MEVDQKAKVVVLVVPPLTKPLVKRCSRVVMLYLTLVLGRFLASDQHHAEIRVLLNLLGREYLRIPTPIDEQGVQVYFA